MHHQWKLINVLEEQIVTERHEKLAQADASKKKIDKAMMKFLMNVEKQELNWEKDFIHENDENIEISDNESQIEIFSDEEFEKESENEKAEI